MVLITCSGSHVLKSGLKQGMPGNTGNKRASGGSELDKSALLKKAESNLKMYREFLQSLKKQMKSPAKNLNKNK